MKEQINRIIFFILMIVTFVVIFIFSNQNAQESKNVSRIVMRKIVDIWPGTNSLEEHEKNKIVENSQKFIRKTAHFTIYTIAGIMIMSYLSTFKSLDYKRTILFTLAIGITYAILDELHQGFSYGRTPLIGDVFIDSSGVILGLLIILSFRINFVKQHKKIS